MAEVVHLPVPPLAGARRRRWEGTVTVVRTASASSTHARVSSNSAWAALWAKRGQRQACEDRGERDATRGSRSRPYSACVEVDEETHQRLATLNRCTAPHHMGRLGWHVRRVRTRRHTVRLRPEGPQGCGLAVKRLPVQR
jgi:hypothetical protein